MARTFKEIDLEEWEIYFDISHIGAGLVDNPLDVFVKFHRKRELRLDSDEEIESVKKLKEDLTDLGKLRKLKEGKKIEKELSE